MKANELMTGDWVLIKRTPSCEYPYKICSINNYSILGEDYADWIEVEAGEEFNLEDIKPIPLTEEILEKNGFSCVVTKGEIAPSIGNFQLDNHWQGEDFSWHQIPMLYVHELQHALKLCGIDKEIKI